MSASPPNAIPEKSLTPARPSPRSRLDLAMRDLATWPEKDKAFFIAAFTTRKTTSQIAQEMGLSQVGYQIRHREIIRRFMRAAIPIASAT